MLANRIPNTTRFWHRSKNLFNIVTIATTNPYNNLVVLYVVVMILGQLP